MARAQDLVFEIPLIQAREPRAETEIALVGFLSTGLTSVTPFSINPRSTWR